MGSMVVPMLLEAGYQVRVLDSLLHGGQSLMAIWSHPEFHFVRGDLCDKKTVEEALDGIDVVVHLAAIVGDLACSKHPDVARRVNRDASLQLLELSQKAEISRFVFASTCSNYGRMADLSLHIDETGCLRPLSLYAETKVAVERAILEVPCGHEFCPTVLRFATLYGVSSRMRFDLTVNEFTMELLVNRRLDVYGKQFWRPYVHVRDASRAILLVLESEDDKIRGEVFNVGATDQNYQKEQLVRMICSLAPDAKIEYVHKEEDPRDYRVSFKKIGEILGFKNTRTVQDGIREVADLIHSQIISDFGDNRFRN